MLECEVALCPVLHAPGDSQPRFVVTTGKPLFGLVGNWPGWVPIAWAHLDVIRKQASLEIICVISDLIII